MIYYICVILKYYLYFINYFRAKYESLSEIVKSLYIH